MLALSARGDQVLLPVLAVPRSGRTTIAGVREGSLRVRLAAPPVDNAANDALRTFLADVLATARGDLEIISGHRGRRKVIGVRGLTEVEIRARLSVHLHG